MSQAMMILGVLYGILGVALLALSDKPAPRAIGVVFLGMCFGFVAASLWVESGEIFSFVRRML